MMITTDTGVLERFWSSNRPNIFFYPRNYVQFRRQSFFILLFDNTKKRRIFFRFNRGPFNFVRIVVSGWIVAYSENQ